jgi:hypothetical protein
MTNVRDASRPVEAAGAVDAECSAHSSLENHKAGFPQLPQVVIIVMTEQEITNVNLSTEPGQAQIDNQSTIRNR